MKVKEIETKGSTFKYLKAGDVFRTLDGGVHLKTVILLDGSVNSVNIHSGLLAWKLDTLPCTPVTMITLVSEEDEPVEPYIT